MGKSQTEVNVNGIMRQLKEYLDLRFAHARRLNAKFRPVEEDLKWHEMECVKQVIARPKPLGEIRVSPADIMVGFDAEKKRGVFAPKGQLSIQNEIITKEDTHLMKGGGGDGIRDMSSFYLAIDPFMKSIIDLMQAWVWWDLPDASDVFLINTQIDKLMKLCRAQVSEQLLAHYKNEMKNPPSGEGALQAILEFEYWRAEDAFVGIWKRRETDENYLIIIGRDHTDTGSDTDAQIMQIAQRLRAMEMMKSAGQMDPGLRDYYAKVLGVPPAEVTPERASQFEQKAILQAKSALSENLASGGEGGTPYNFKMRQALELRRRMDAMKAELKIRPREAKPQDD